jgi:CRISP-associated protein Cas1
MLNEYAYCPRLFALEWSNGDWADSKDTVEGSTVHRRVDQESRDSLPSADRPEESVVRRSVSLGDPELGFSARIDLVEAEGLDVSPLDYKKGRPAPDGGPWEPEAVQLCAYALLLRTHGYRCERGYLYYAAVKRRVEVVFSEALIARTLQLRDAALAVAASGQLPEPLVDSPKCPRCSLVGICMPDESAFLRKKVDMVRPMIPAREDALPLYVTTQGAYVGKDHDELVVKDDGAVIAKVGLGSISRVVIWGNVAISTPMLRELAYREIPVSFHSAGGWHYANLTPAWGHNVISRIAQHKVASDERRSLDLARSFVHSKILNCRVLLRRNAGALPDVVLSRLKLAAEDARGAPNIASLMGTEGTAAALYFEHFPLMISSDLREEFDFSTRNRRPPRDAVNCLLSFAYACLTREITTMLASIGLDPFVGFLHQPRYGRASLALDLMEEFRPIIADSVVLTLINTRAVQPSDFIRRTTGVAMSDSARRSFLQAWERRLDEVILHPVLENRLSYRRILEVQARLLAKTLTGELDSYPEFRVR